MRMDGVRPCVNYMTKEAQRAFFFSYFEMRKEDFERVVVKPKRAISTSSSCSETGKGRKKRDEKISLTPEEFELLKKLGLC